MKNLLFSLVLLLILNSCDSNESTEKGIVEYNKTPLTAQQKEYWYDGSAEISSYIIAENRYGEQRPGETVLIYVTEPFSTMFQAKSDNASETDHSVLKLNRTTNFITGIYPYSIMTSSFYPCESTENSLKVSSSIQEWCGHIYMESNTTSELDIQISSYFEAESQKLTIKSGILEDDIWTMIRLHPDQLPEGKTSILPSFSYLRMNHIKTKYYDCEISKTIGESNTDYSLYYKELNRTFTFTYQNDFPYKILRWKESNLNKGDKQSVLISTGELLKTVKVDYWNNKSVADSVARKSLGL
jgi:hypothetical protein